MEQDELLNSLWVEKYRPSKISEIVLREREKIFFSKCINDKEIPHVLLIGPPGSGKSTLARIVCDELIADDMDLLALNGSDERGIGTVRDDIIPFLKSPPYESKHKIVFIDEFDNMTPDCFKSLRNVFEKYHTTGRFICTGNYKSKIEPALISRFQLFEMKRLSDEYIIEFCEKILKSENIEYNVDDVKLLVQTLSPDVRKIINILQQSTDNGKLSNLDKDSITGVEQKIIGLICQICDELSSEKEVNKQIVNNNVSMIQNEIGKQELDYLQIYEKLFSSEIPLWAKIEVNKYSNEHNRCAIPHIHFVAMCWSIIQNGTNYRKVFGS